MSLNCLLLQHPRRCRIVFSTNTTPPPGKKVSTTTTKAPGDGRGRILMPTGELLSDGDVALKYNPPTQEESWEAQE